MTAVEPSTTALGLIAVRSAGRLNEEHHVIISNARWLRFAVAGGLLAGGLTFSTALPAAAATCTSGVAGDVNGDGYAEVAVSEGGRSYGEGAIHVFYGRPKGLAAGASGKALDDQYLDQDTAGVAGDGRDHELFGSATDDLAIGTPNDGVGAARRAGSVTILLGSPTGLTTAGAGGTRFHQDVAGIAGTAELVDSFGQTLAISNVQSKTQGSLIIGVPREDIGGVERVGQFHQLSTSATGPTGTGSVTLHLDSAGVKGKPRQEAEFGRALG